MSKFTIPNKPGKYELDEMTLRVFPDSIEIVTHHKKPVIQQQAPYTDQSGCAPSRMPQDNNMSILSSLTTIADTIKSRRGGK